MGRKLIDELDLEPSVDTLARWMAHYLAELIDAAEHASLKERTAAKKRCFKAILELWSHRAELPTGKRPFEDLEPIMRALESLDPDDDTPRYFRSVRSAIVETKEDSQTRLLLETVRSLDSTARILIGYYLAEAAGSAADKSKEWIALAEGAGTDLGITDVVFRFVSSKTLHTIKDNPNEAEREVLQDRIQRLENFANVAKLISDDFKVQLNSLSSHHD